MADQRIQKMAGVLVNYSLKLKKGERFLIQANPVAEPLVKEVYKEAVKAGAFVDTRISLEGLRENFFKYADDEQLVDISPIQKMVIDEYDAMLTISGGNNTKSFSNVDPQKMAKSRGAQRDLMTKFVTRIGSGDLKWCGTQFPTNSAAQDANMSLEEYEDFVYGSCNLDYDNPIEKWLEVSQRQEKLAKILDTKKELHFVSSNTDIKMSVEGRKWINCDGRENFPDGEIFTTPIKDSANGYIRYTYPAIYGGKEVEDVELTFENGKVVKATAAKGEEYLISILDTDEGARFLGEVAIGTNYGIKEFSKNILFDEKIGGTIHLAIGAALPETGGQNESSVHWDMICDMKEDGKIYADGELIYEKGQFLIGN